MKDIAGHPDPADHDDAIPFVKKKMGHKAQGIQPYGRLDKRAGGGWIKNAVKKPGALHRALGVAEGEKIPEAKIEKAAVSSNTHMRQMANFAKNVR